MKLGLLVGWLCLFATGASAHRLDEYLQATRIAVVTNRVELSLDLTPGVAVVDQLLVLIDKDRDGRVSDAEATAYARRVLSDIQLRLNEKVLAPGVVHATFPALNEVRGGLGVIRIKATAPVEPLAAGDHVLSLPNAHLPAISVYLVNALVPKDRAIKITKQTRDEHQKDYRLEFQVSYSPP